MSRLRAVVLAAGHGTRLAPLTSELPKPLLPILGKPLVSWTLERLAALGVEATAINLHHRAQAIPAALGDRCGAMPLRYSPEAEILGTLGALHPLRDFLAPADLVLLVNGDSLCEWPFEELVARHLETAPLATLLLSSTADAEAFGGGVAIDDLGRVVAFPPERATVDDGAERGGGARVAARRVFAGAHVFAPALAREAPPRFSDSVRDLYRPKLAAGAVIQTLSTAAPWHDLGTPARYLDAVLDWAARDPRRAGRASWIAASARVEAGARLERAVVESAASVEAGADLRDALVLDGGRVGRGSRLERVVVGPGVEVAPGCALADVLLTRAPAQERAAPDGERKPVSTPLRGRGSR